ncbi:MAG TPA: response regulator transcription factor [Puia sp.]|nr:response regulator transcription factor [Puia sp.]
MYIPTINLLIVDDHQLIIDGLSAILAGEPLIDTLFTAREGREAVNLVIEKDIDCVLMDINMPVIGGYEATELIKSKKPHIKIIMVSMISDASVVAKLLKAGADAFIIKNTGKLELLAAIKKVMAGEKYVSQELCSDLYRHFGSARRKTSEGPYHLTRREIEIIRYVAAGLTNQEIAIKLFLSHNTVETHRKNIIAKLGLKNTASLVKYAADNKLL